MSPRRRTLLGVGAVAAAGAVAATLARRRGRADEPLARVRGGNRSKLETSDGAVLDVHDAGDGPTIVLSHGWTNDMRIWEPVAAALVAHGHRVVRYDQRGHGSSTVGADGCAVERLADDLYELLEHLDLRDAVVVGHSMGGMTAQALAIEHPDALVARVRAFVLVSTSSGGLADLPLARLAPSIIGVEAINRALVAPGGHALVRGVFGRRANRYAVRLTRDTFVETVPGVRLAQFNALAAMDLVGGRKALTVPTTVVVGTRDTLTPPRMSRELAADIPGARLVTVPGAGHMLPLESTDLIVELIEEAAR